MTSTLVTIFDSFKIAKCAIYISYYLVVVYVPEPVYVNIL